MSDTRTSVAFLGLGAIGRPIAHHIAAKGFPLAVWNRTPAKALDFRKETGARIGADPADAAKDAQVLITCLPSSKEVHQLVFEHGLLDGIGRGAILVDCTSGDPPTSRRIAAALADRGIDFLDAPVSGGVAGAVAAKLTVMCGGTPQQLARAHPVLSTFAQKIVLCGPTGAGHAVKAVNNALLATHILITAEGLLAAARAGVDPRVALEVINSSSGRSNTSENLFPERVLSGAYPRTFRLALLDKDVRIAADLAKEAKTPHAVLSLVSDMFANARAELGEEADHVEVVRLLERDADIVLKISNVS
jgi:3-hydroxyisobutyrate dehydrogenase